MNQTTSKGGRTFLAAAAVAGLVAVLAGVYVTVWGAGNGADAATCAAAEAKAERIEPLVRGEVAALLPASTSADLRPLAFTAPDGSAKTVADFSGKVLLLNLWATWCVPCREEMPALDRLQAARGSADFEVVAVNVDVGDPAKPAAFLEEEGIEGLADYRDPKMKIFNDLKVRSLAIGMPTTLLVDEAGCHVAVMHGPAEWDSPDGLAVVDALLAE